MPGMPLNASKIYRPAGHESKDFYGDCIEHPISVDSRLVIESSSRESCLSAGAPSDRWMWFSVYCGVRILGHHRLAGGEFFRSLRIR